MWITIDDNLKWDTLEHFGMEQVQWQCEQYAAEGYGKSNLTYLIFPIWIHSPICEYNNPAPSLRFTLQHKYITELTLTTNYLTSANSIWQPKTRYLWTFRNELVQHQCEYYELQKDTERVTLHTLSYQYEYTILYVNTIVPLLPYVSLYNTST